MSQVRRSEAFCPGSHFNSLGPTFKKLRYLEEREGGREEGGREEGGERREGEREGEKVGERGRGEAKREEEDEKRREQEEAPGVHIG